MTRALGAVAGVLIAAVASYFAVSAAGEWYSPRFESDDEINQFMMFGLAFQALCMIGGGWIGYWFAKRRVGLRRA